MKRMLFISDLNASNPSSLLRLVSSNSHQVRNCHKRIGVSAVQVFSNQYLLTLLEGEQDAITTAIDLWRDQNHHTSMSPILDMQITHRINTAPMRLIPLKSEAHTAFMLRLKTSCSSSLTVKSSTDICRWRDFADWGYNNANSDDFDFRDRSIFMLHWPNHEDISLNDDAMVICAIIANKSTHYNNLVARNILSESELNELLVKLKALGLLKLC